MTAKRVLRALTTFAVERPRVVIALALLATAAFLLQFPKIRIDTDPENMLQADQPDRVVYNQVKKDFGIHDLIVVGIIDEQGIYRPEALEKIARITDEILKIEGVIIEDVVSLTTTDNVTSTGGFLEVGPVMEAIPNSQDELEALRAEITDNPFLHEKIASADGTAAALYIPIEKKDQSYRISREIKEIAERELGPGQTYHIAGLPAAEDTFGHEMFLQMAVTAPLAMFAIMVLLFLLFRRALLILPPMVDAMFAVIWSMGLLIGTGFTVHIMSSMIPVFLMPIAVLDDVHVLSEFFDRYPRIREKKRAILAAMEDLYLPMLYTSLTSAVGFASLSLARIPPVQVFGLFVAFGIMAAWLFSMTMVPAIIMLIPEKRLASIAQTGGRRRDLLGTVLHPLGRFAYRRAPLVALVAFALLALGILGLSRIEVNDNPVNWFKPHHPIRVADQVMNRLFGGTYMAYLVARGEREGDIKRPEVVGYLTQLQSALKADPLIGKTSSVADIVQRVNYVLHDQDKAHAVVPDSRDAVAQLLFLFQSSGDPGDLDNFVDYDYRQANIWLQMKGGENEQMGHVERLVEDFTRQNPLPQGITLRWSGLTYINKVWQDLMVKGMLRAILGSFAVVFLLMLLQFRSFSLGLISMLPLSFAIVLSYGLVGLIGKDYDMPIAVCSSLSLGLGIDFAIHFLQRFKERYRETGDLEATNAYIFEEPGRGIARSAIVITLGFLPLMTSTLMPYVTVGAFFAALMVFSTLSTLLLLPALMRLLGRRILKGGGQE